MIEGDGAEFGREAGRWVNLPEVGPIAIRALTDKVNWRLGRSVLVERAALPWPGSALDARTKAVDGLRPGIGKLGIAVAERVVAISAYAIAQHELLVFEKELSKCPGNDVLLRELDVARAAAVDARRFHRSSSMSRAWPK
jgi:hypothetical protein